MNYFTKNELLSVQGDNVKLIDLNINEESSVIISEYGGRPLAIFPRNNDYSLLWIAPNIKEAIEKRDRKKRKIPSYDYDPKAGETMEKLMSYDYYILKNNTGNDFYASDHPISQFETSEKEGIKIAIPLAPDLFLIMYKGEEWMQIYPRQTVVINKWFVNEANEATIQAANDFIFSRTNDFEFVKLVLNTNDK